MALYRWNSIILRRAAFGNKIARSPACCCFGSQTVSCCCPIFLPTTVPPTLTVKIIAPSCPSLDGKTNTFVEAQPLPGEDCRSFERKSWNLSCGNAVIHVFMECTTFLVEGCEGIRFGMQPASSDCTGNGSTTWKLADTPCDCDDQKLTFSGFSLANNPTVPGADCCPCSDIKFEVTW